MRYSRKKVARKKEPDKPAPIPKHKKQPVTPKAMKENIEKELGEMAMNLINDSSQFGSSAGYVSTGSVLLDFALGGRGLPYGKIVLLFGKESSWKSTLAAEVIKSCQAEGGMGIYYNQESTLDEEHFIKDLGISSDTVIHNPILVAENLLDSIYGHIKYIRKNDINKKVVMVLDTISAMASANEMEKKMQESAKPGDLARLMSAFCRRGIVGELTGTKILIVLISQVREKIDSSPMGKHFGGGKVEDITGGNAVKHYISVRLDLSRKTGDASKITKNTKYGEVVIGETVGIYVAKSRVSVPYQRANVNFLFKSGIDNCSSVLDKLIESKFITQVGSYYQNYLFGKGKDGDDKKLRYPQIIKLMREQSTLYPLMVDECAKLYNLTFVEETEEVIK